MNDGKSCGQGGNIFIFTHLKIIQIMHKYIFIENNSGNIDLQRVKY